MSNKKLFWLVFMVLSICEFGQFAYSQNTPKEPLTKDIIVNHVPCAANIPIKEVSALPMPSKNDFLPR